MLHSNYFSNYLPNRYFQIFDVLEKVTKILVGGVWKTVVAIYISVSEEWKAVTAVYVKSTTWRGQ